MTNIVAALGGQSVGNVEQRAGNESPNPAPAIRMVGITKTFGGVVALKDVRIEVKRGEIHALLGGNGAGKSTLLKILRGVQSPDTGTIEVNGQPLIEHTVEAARLAGIAMIFQEMSLIPTLTAAQNIFLNREPRNRFGLIDDQACIRLSRGLFQEFHVDIEPTELVAQMSAGQRQLTEIIKAMSQRSSILILDEPSSALTETEVGLLFSMLRHLKTAGVAIIYVSHRMDEIMHIADRATILRDGRYVMSAPLSDLTIETIIGHIVGQEGRNLTVTVDNADSVPGEIILELKGVSGSRRPLDVSLTVRRGEVVGIAGLLGSGRSALARLLYGISPVVAGEIRVNGKTVHFASPREAIAEGIALIPEDRLLEGLIVQHSVASNVCLPVLKQLSRYTWVLTGRSAALVRKQIDFLRIKTDSPGTSALALSGGNQQKVVLAKGLATAPDILILDEPTAGIDIGSKTEIVELIRELARQGKAVILISSEMAELIAASDRIILMAKGRLAGEIDPRRDLISPDTAPSERLSDAQRRLQIAIQKVNSND